MTNNMIVLMERVELMKQGVLDGTGEYMTVEDKDGNKVQVEMPEEIYTYAKWKEKGYQVQKGQKAIAQISIWKHTTRENENGEEESKMFMKKASFFKQSQVEKIEEGARQ